MAEETISKEVTMRRSHEDPLHDKLIVNGHDDGADRHRQRRLEKMTPQHIQMLDKGHLFRRPTSYPSLK
jgi:hypothetical protein